MELARTLSATCNPQAPRPSPDEAARSAFILTMICVELVPGALLCPEFLLTFQRQEDAIHRQFCAEQEV